MSGVLDEHQGYVEDTRRLEKFRTAISKAVRPGDRIADVGCGTGVLGLLCLQAGAKHVAAIDSSAAIEVARESLTRAGWASRADFIHASSQQVDLPEKVDVVICDHVGYFGFDYGVVGILDDARRRFLKPGGRLVPERIRLLLCGVESEKCAALAGGWNAPGVPQEFHWLNGHAVNTKHAATLSRDELLCAPAELGSIDLAQDDPGYFHWSTRLTMTRNGTLHGLAGWFDCELADGVWMTNSPLSDEAIKRSQVFLPIEEPLVVQAGDEIDAVVMARPGDHLIAWQLRHVASGRRFSHSTWLGYLVVGDQLARSRPDHVPALSAQTRARLVVLGYCDGKRTRGEVRAAVLRDHPALFPSPGELSRFVEEVLARDTL